MHWLSHGNSLLKRDLDRPMKERNQDKILFQINAAQCIEEKNKLFKIFPVLEVFPVFKVTNQPPEDQFRLSFCNERIVVRLDLENYLKQSFEVSEM